MDNINRNESKSWFWDLFLPGKLWRCPASSRIMSSCGGRFFKADRLTDTSRFWNGLSLSPFQSTTNGLHKDNQPMTRTSWSWTMANGSYGVRRIWSPWQVTCLSRRRWSCEAGGLRQKWLIVFFLSKRKRLWETSCTNMYWSYSWFIIHRFWSNLSLFSLALNFAGNETLECFSGQLLARCAVR